MTKYRVKYNKGEEVKFIGHLDMLKVFSRAAVRADISVSFSEGFNPHPDFVFGLPLAVGVTSEAEYVDITLDEEMAPEELLIRFNGTMPEGIKLTECEKILPGTANIMKSVTASEYTVTVSLKDKNGGDYSQEELFKRMKEVYDRKEPVNVEKKSKSGKKVIDIMPWFFKFDLMKYDEKTAVLYLKTSAGNEATLRPDLALAGLSSAADVICETEATHRLSLM